MRRCWKGVGGPPTPSDVFLITFPPKTFDQRFETEILLKICKSSNNYAYGDDITLHSFGKRF